jgi:phosphatidylserine decarboxylase
MALIVPLLLSAAVLVGLFLAFHRFVFLRDPERIVPKGQGLVSPADGTIIQVLTWDKDSTTLRKSFGKVPLILSDVAQPCKIISIFMSPLNVHVNRVPCDGTVKAVAQHRGKFLAANTLEALQNERCELLLTTKFGSVKVVQVAGFIARRIECWVVPGQEVRKGQRFGRINLGSQVVLVVPAKVRVLVKKGQKVRAGETVLVSP